MGTVTSYASMAMLSFVALTSSATQSSNAAVDEAYAERTEHLEKLLLKIDLGDDVGRVKKVLGPPNLEQLVQHKTATGRFVQTGKCLTYSIHTIGPTPGNIHDRLVLLFFDTRGHLAAGFTHGYATHHVPSQEDEQQGISESIF